MTAVILALNSRYIHSSLAPFCLKEYANNMPEQESTYDIRIIDTNINRASQVIADEVSAIKPDIIGVSVYVFNRTKAIELIGLLKKRLPDAFIFCGGPEASADGETFLKVGAACVIRGGGEEIFREILDEYPSLQGFKGIIESVAPRYDYSPYSDEYFEKAKGKIAYFEASRGCPFRCSYCMSADGVSHYAAAKVKQELLRFKNRDIRILKFTDRTFNYDLPYAKELLRFLAEEFEDDGIGFHFEIAPDIYDGEFIEIIKNAKKGLFQFEAGFQSFQEKTLIAVNRRQDIAKSNEFLKRTASGNCLIHADLIAGLPYEDIDGLKKSFDSLYALAPDEIQLGTLKFLKGSLIREQADTGFFDVSDKKYRYSTEAPYEIISSPYLSAEDVILIKKLARTVAKLYNSRRFCQTLKYVIKEPFAFFKDFTLYAEAVGAEMGTIRLDKLFVLLYGYLIKSHDPKYIKNLLKFDYLSSVKDNLPEALKSFDTGFKRRLAKLGIPPSGVYAFDINPLDKKDGAVCLRFDYSVRDAVSGRYACSLVEL
ncbi:MAG: DUF4080 domain-containing protein [Clostridiales bacterium]|jgi:radical SAM superfamily enzyme YgiQ (UPF0313 family)|nr:DUF4080 domain-containing protein [Clostridiales bacterium]